MGKALTENEMDMSGRRLMLFDWWLQQDCAALFRS